jgi:[acyl-carrier-protein] S-malonyltransferase
MTKTAWVFPGQGSQSVGMGADVLHQARFKTKVDEASKILGWSVAEVCQGEEETLSKTLYTQPCLYVVECLLVDALKERGHHPDVVAGHSLGEYVALYAAGVLEFTAGLTLVHRRAELMDDASDGMMAALIGCDRDQLDEQIEQTPGVVLANDNNAGQVVISGTPEAVEAIMASVKAKRAIKLNVSGAFHSPLMKEAAAEFETVLNAVPFHPAQVPVLSNVDPAPTIAADLLKQRLNQQMTGPVRWREISLQLPELGTTHAIEVGPGKVLTGLIKRTCPELTLSNIGTLGEIPPP